VPLLCIDIVELHASPSPAFFGSGSTRLSDESRAQLRRVAEEAVRGGVPAEILHVRTLRPRRALRELVDERRPALVVLGPDRAKVDRRLYRALCKELARLECFTWREE
jgi:hypothetical protein